MKWISLFVLLFLAASCIEEADFNPIRIEDPYVLNGLISPACQLEVSLSRTTDIADTNLIVVFPDYIELYEDGILLPVVMDTAKSFITLGIIPKCHRKYRIRLSFPGLLESVWAEDSVPSMVSLQNATYRYPAYTGQYQTTYGDLEITFKDEKNTVNYYEIFMLRDTRLIQTFNVKSPVITMDTERDPVMLPSILFSDEKFKDTSLVMHVFTDASKNPTVFLRNVSVHYYHYKKYLYQHLNNQNIERENIYDIFKGDPFDLYSNVENGLGIFAAYSESSLLSRTVK